MTLSPPSNNLTIRLWEPHAQQAAFMDSPAKRKIIRAGRRGGKTTGMAIYAVRKFLEGRRVLYAVPTAEQIDRFWSEVTRALREPIEAGVLYKNETRHIIELPGTEQRIRGKTAWNADSLRGDYADELILDEWQLMDESAWGEVGAPMLLDNNGNAVFIYTPPSLLTRSHSKARDPRHAAKMYKAAEADTSGKWAAFHFSSHDNPYISSTALEEIAQDMTALAYQQEIEALDLDEDPRALWNHALIDKYRVASAPDLVRIVVAVDPPGGSTECGIVVAGADEYGHAYVLADHSLLGSPLVWGNKVNAAYFEWEADRVLGEKNFGGDMVRHTVRTAEGGQDVAYKDVHASRGKQIRAEPVSAKYERGLVHHVGRPFTALEDEMCGWVPGEGMPSPNRLDGLVWAITELLLGRRKPPEQEDFLR